MPTDSELGVEDYAQLSSHIARRYEIRNTDGKDARIIEINGLSTSTSGLTG
jgi:hypothetical protein